MQTANTPLASCLLIQCWIYFVSCHRKPILFIHLFSKKSLSSSYPHSDWNPSNKHTTIQGPSLEMIMLTNTGNAEATSTFKSRVAWFVQKPKTSCWSSWCRWKSGQAPGQSSAIFQHVHTCMHIHLFIYAHHHFNSNVKIYGNNQEPVLKPISTCKAIK